MADTGQERWSAGRLFSGSHQADSGGFEVISTDCRMQYGRYPDFQGGGQVLGCGSHLPGAEGRRRALQTLRASARCARDCSTDISSSGLGAQMELLPVLTWHARSCWSLRSGLPAPRARRRRGNCISWVQIFYELLLVLVWEAKGNRLDL